MARKKDTYEPKSTKSKWDISDWTLDNSFMTDDEIKQMMALLKGHMFMKYGTYNEEIIHMSILQGLRMSHQYNSQKASKLVWFQSILRNIFINHVDPKYNRAIRHHYSLDWKDEEGEENVDIINEVLSKSSNGDDEDREEVINFTDEIVKMINDGEYIILKLRVQGESYSSMGKILNMKTHQLASMWKGERERLKEEIKMSIGEVEILQGRKPLNLWMKRRPRKAKKERVYVSPIRICRVCEKDFKFEPGMGPNTRTCSEQCKLELKKTTQSAYFRNLYYEKTKGRRNT